jgi:acyl dehydratase
MAAMTENLEDKTSAPRHPRGGLYFEDLVAGLVIPHRLTRTVTQMDNILFSSLTLNPQPLHIDAHYCATETQWGKPLMNSLFTLGLIIGISVNDTTLGTTIANLGMSKVVFPAPLFEGDTVHVKTTVLESRLSRSRPDRGIVTFLHEGFKQDETCIARAERQAMMLCRETLKA